MPPTVSRLSVHAYPCKTSYQFPRFRYAASPKNINENCLKFLCPEGETVQV